MSFKVSFRRLAEVRILHSFYLENDVKSTFYTLTEEKKAQRYLEMDYDIRRDISIIPTDECTRFLKNNKITFLPSITGFVLAIEVASKDGKTKPVANLPQDWRLSFEIIVKNPNWVTFTNTKLKSTQSPLRFYWTNIDDIKGKSLPSLAVPLTEKADSKQYEMGEWALINGAKSRAQINNGQWLGGESFDNYSTEEDRRALPRQSKFLPVPLTTKAEIVLTKPNDKTESPFEAKWIVESGSGTPLSIIAVDFSINPKDKQLIPKGLYDLSISCQDNKGVGTTAVYKNIILLDGVKPSSYGFIELIQKSNLPDNKTLLNTEGGVIEGATVFQGGQVFEIRLQNRITFWRYRGRNDKQLSKLDKMDNAQKDILGDTLITKKPYPLTRKELIIESKDDIKLRSPTKLNIIEKDNRFYTEVWI
jgi:hypothetical protein